MLRAKITPAIEADGSILVRVEWIDDETRETQRAEEFRVKPDRIGCSFVSELVFSDEPHVSIPYFVDEEGRRHFRARAETARVGAVAGSLGG